MSDDAIKATQNDTFLVGRCLSRSAGILRRNFVSFITLSFIFTIPSMVLEFLFSDTENLSDSKDMQVLIGAAVYFVQFILSYLVNATIVYGVISDLRGQRATVVDAINRGLPMLLPVLIVAIISSISMVFGFVLFVIPGIVIMTMLWFSVPVVVAERSGIFASLSRSTQLSKGYRWKILGLILITLVITYITDFIGISVPLAILDFSIVDIKTYLEILSKVIRSIIFAVISALAYHDVRIAKEGISTDDIASVFE